ncbi:MAG: hypothetical protein Q4C47_03640 [Planctomycetia bacterium]|nr:hypothetical protein [Planctomycetia bacterium]
MNVAVATLEPERFGGRYRAVERIRENGRCASDFRCSYGDRKQESLIAESRATIGSGSDAAAAEIPKRFGGRYRAVERIRENGHYVPDFRCSYGDRKQESLIAEGRATILVVAAATLREFAKMGAALPIFAVLTAIGNKNLSSPKVERPFWLSLPRR